MNLSAQSLTSVAVLAVLALIPVLVSWIVFIVPSRRREATGLVVGNALDTAPMAQPHDVITKPLVSLSRELSSAGMGGFLLGLRHAPVEQAAPLLARYVRCSDPALQLYAQSILAQGRETLQVRLAKLERTSSDDARLASWMLEAGLVLANPTLTGAAERPGFLKYLAQLAASRLETCEHTPALLANATRVFLEAGRAGEASNAVTRLPEGSPLRLELEPAVAHALRQQSLGA